jgi:hypothetical protein
MRMESNKVKKIHKGQKKKKIGQIGNGVKILASTGDGGRYVYILEGEGNTVVD